MSDATRPEEATDDRTPGHRSDEVDVVAMHTPRSWWTWILLLSGPVTWALHFVVVYLVVEAWCSNAAASAGPLPTWLGAAAPVSMTLVATGVAAAVIVADFAFTSLRYRQAARPARREDEDATDTADQLVRDRQLLFVGCLLGPLSLLAVLFVGLSALWVPTC